MYCPISIDTSIQYYFSIRLHQKFLGKGGKKKKKKKEIWMFSKSLDLDGNKITNSIHWYAPKKQNELPNMEDALISNFHTHKLHIIQYFWLFYYQFSIQIFIDFYYIHTIKKSFTRSYFQNSSTIITHCE